MKSPKYQVFESILSESKPMGEYLHLLEGSNINEKLLQRFYSNQQETLTYAVEKTVLWKFLMVKSWKDASSKSKVRNGGWARESSFKNLNC